MSLPQKPQKISLLKRERIWDKIDSDYGLSCSRRFKSFDDGQESASCNGVDIYLLEEVVAHNKGNIPIKITVYPLATNADLLLTPKAIPRKDTWEGYLNGHSRLFYRDMKELLRITNGDFKPIKEAISKISQFDVVNLTTDPQSYLFNEAETNIYKIKTEKLGIDKLLDGKKTIVVPETMFDEVFINWELIKGDI